MPPAPTPAPQGPPDDPYEAHFWREPLPGAGVCVVVLDPGDGERAGRVASDLIGRLARLGRAGEARVEPFGPELPPGAAVERAANATAMPLVLVTTAIDPWSDEHLDALLKAVDRVDHAFGRRRRGLGGRLLRWLATRPWRFVFAVPVLDVHTPCRIHRRDRLASIPIQSGGAFGDVELIAKATFLGHVLDEPAVPPLAAAPLPHHAGDFGRVFRSPVFVRRSAPAEDPQGDDEGDDRPGGEDGERARDGHEAGPLEQHPA